MSAVSDTTDLRAGAPLHDRLLALLPLVGLWAGRGTVAVESTGETHEYAQAVTFAHDGRPFLAYESQTWLLDSEGAVLRAAFRERGFWRPGVGQDDVEVVLADAAGLLELLTGTAGDARWELETSAVQATATARAVGGERRLYAVVDDELRYATELQLPGGAFAPHLNATLNRAHS